MAQAARLNLRMQKELKLLLTDPPPGVSFPSLPDGSSASSLTSFDALLQGPEGSVYADGAFKIKIQIPERYPFQPPIVAFATPIYHPNIDNGGRICLDILSLPPKGTWKPSLNISTVLTSIGLLLSEPNPDDGLMHDASREYKYNRQTFDENARFITEKYARESESAKGYHGSQTHIGSSTGQTETEESGPSICVTEHFVCHEMCSGSGRKRSLESLGSSSNHDSGIHKLHLHDCLMNHIDNGPLNEANKTSAEHAGNPGKLHATRNKMPLKISLVSHSKDDGSTKMESENQYSSLLENQTRSTDPLAFLPLVQVGNNHELISDREDYTERSHCTSVGPEQQLSCCVKTSQSRDSNEKLRSVPKHDASPLDSTGHLEALPLLLDPSHNRTSSKIHTGKKEHDSTSMSLKKAGLIGLTPSSGAVGCSQHLLRNEKEYTSPLQCLTPQLAGQPSAQERAGKQEMFKGLALSQTDAQLPLEPADQLLGYNNLIILQSTNASSPHSKFLHVANDLRYDEKQQTDQVCHEDSAGKLKLYSEGPHMPEAVIVLDSEDSEDGNVPVRSKLSLDKRRMTRKRKA